MIDPIIRLIAKIDLDEEKDPVELSNELLSVIQKICGLEAVKHFSAHTMIESSAKDRFIIKVPSLDTVPSLFLDQFFDRTPLNDWVKILPNLRLPRHHTTPLPKPSAPSALLVNESKSKLPAPSAPALLPPSYDEETGAGEENYDVPPPPSYSEIDSEESPFEQSSEPLPPYEPKLNA